MPLKQTPVAADAVHILRITDSQVAGRGDRPRGKSSQQGELVEEREKRAGWAQVPTPEAKIKDRGNKDGDL